MSNTEATQKNAPPAAAILEQAVTWPRVTTRPNPRGSIAVVFEDKELGHVHLDRGTLDLPLSDTLRAQALRDGRAKEWYSPWVSKTVGDEADASDAIELLCESYDERHAS